MLTKATIEERLRMTYPQLAAKYGLKKLGLFGSFARDVGDENSDVDLLVEFDRPVGFKFMELADELEELLGRKVDLVTQTGLGQIRSGDIARDIAESVEYV